MTEYIFCFEYGQKICFLEVIHQVQPVIFNTLSLKGSVKHCKKLKPLSHLCVEYGDD